jgi:tetratricopeptide (TPR) repeat protein
VQKYHENIIQHRTNQGQTMKKISFVVIFVLCFIIQSVAQNSQGTSKIDLLLIQGNYRRIIDTCKLILKYDTLNPDIYYKMGVACQNMLKEDLALDCFQKAASLDPENNAYSFSLAKAFYNAGKFRMAEPMLKKICYLDSMNWAYAYYLSGIYMQTDRYEDAIEVYGRFLKNDSTNYVYHDKIAFASLKNGDFPAAIEWYNKSLSLNEHNLTAIKNLSWLYASNMQPDTAIQLLSKGIEIDSTDLDLHIRRAQINFSKNWTKKALDDYLVLLAAGDSTTIYLKRAGIGYCYNFQPKEAIVYLLKAYEADSTDYETSSFLGQSYYLIKDMTSSIYYYNRAIKILSAVNSKMALTHTLLADSQKGNREYKAAIENYLEAYTINKDANLNMVVANIYDEKLQNRDKAIFYYERFLKTQKNSRLKLPPEYIDKVEKRLEYLKKSQPKPK